jgi:ELWxxDGT repeat protein
LLLLLAIVTILTTLQPASASTQLARRVKEINTAVASAGSLPSKGVQIGNITYFSADDGINGSELWRTDGTTGGTWLVKDIRLGAGSSNPESLTVTKSVVFFLADDNSSGRELWVMPGWIRGEFARACCAEPRDPVLRPAEVSFWHRTRPS